MESSPKLSTHVVVSRAITFDSCSDLSSATHDKCANNVSTMLVELQWLSGCRSLSGKKTRTWMVTQQTRISLEACIVLRVHLTAMLTSLVLCNPTSYTCGNTWMHTIFWQHLSPRIEERGFRPSFDLTKQHLLLLMTLWHWGKPSLGSSASSSQLTSPIQKLCSRARCQAADQCNCPHNGYV